MQNSMEMARIRDPRSSAARAGLWRGGNEEEQGEVISVYYINKLETRITAVERVLESSQVEEQVEEVLEALAENPVELSLRTPVSGFEIKSWKLQETQLSLDVSEEYKKIPPLRKCWCAPRWCAA